MSTPRPRRVAPRTARALSQASDSSFICNTPVATGPRLRSTRGVRGATAESENNPDTPIKPPEPKAPLIPAHYKLPPTVPRPFIGSLEASLDAILLWGQLWSRTNPSRGLQDVLNGLLRPVSAETNWLTLIRDMVGYFRTEEVARQILESLLFLVTRTLLPEQIVENREFMARLYDRKKHLAIRFVMRYDLLREWKVVDSAAHPLAVNSVPADPGVRSPAPVGIGKRDGYVERRPFMPNIWATLISAPPGGYVTFGMRERMKHHVTELDRFLLLKDEDVSAWEDATLLSMISQVILHWQWLRQNNEELEGMEVRDWDDLDGRADDCDWIIDDPRKAGGAKREPKVKAAERRGKKR